MKFAITFVCIIILGISFVKPAESSSEEKSPENLTIQKPLNLESQADSIQYKIDTMMQNTASWLDNIAADDSDESQEVAAANGYVQFGWMPRTADFSKFDPKFKVHLSLPRWNDKVALVFDNDDEDEMKLDYEASSVGQDHETEDLNIAIQYVKRIGDTFNIKYRAGISRDQLYARSEVKKYWRTDSYSVGIVPRLDYFHSDGWAPSIKGTITIPMDNDIVSFSASWQKVEKENDSRQKIGLYYVSSMGVNNELVSGIQYFNNKDSKESYLVSIRHRNLMYKDWLFFELEPFLEFKQERDYRRELGLAIRLIAYYGSN